MDMKKTFALIILTVFLTINTAAQPEIDHESLRNSFKSEGTNPLIAFLAGDQRIELEISTNRSERFVIGIETSGANITDTNEDGFENPTISIQTSPTVLKEVTDAEKPLEELNNQLGDGVVLRANGLFNKMRIGLIKLVIRMAG